MMMLSWDLNTFAVWMGFSKVYFLAMLLEIHLQESQQGIKFHLHISCPENLRFGTVEALQTYQIAWLISGQLIEKVVFNNILSLVLVEMPFLINKQIMDGVLLAKELFPPRVNSLEEIIQEGWHHSQD